MTRAADIFRMATLEPEMDGEGFAGEVESACAFEMGQSLLLKMKFPVSGHCCRRVARPYGREPPWPGIPRLLQTCCTAVEGRMQKSKAMLSMLHRTSSVAGELRTSVRAPWPIVHARVQDAVQLVDSSETHGANSLGEGQLHRGWRSRHSARG